MYVVHNLHLDRLGVMNVVPHSSVTDGWLLDREVRKQFGRAAKVGARVKHPRLIEVYGADDIDGFLYLTMEYVRGRSVADRLRAADVPSIEQAVGWLLDAARGLEALRAAGVIHRDAKPSNLLVLGNGRVAVGGLR